jgi:hypothetical protein
MRGKKWLPLAVSLSLLICIIVVDCTTNGVYFGWLLPFGIMLTLLAGFELYILASHKKRGGNES